MIIETLSGFQCPGKGKNELILIVIVVQNSKIAQCVNSYFYFKSLLNIDIIVIVIEHYSYRTVASHTLWQL